ncbi:MAG: hypothetical protein WKF91_14465 [Segetibacter sp.]
MSFINEIGKWIKGWRLDKIFKGIAEGDKDVAQDLEEKTKKAIEFVQWLKEQIRSTGGLITSVIPGTWDDDLKAKAELFLEKATSNARLLSECAEKPTPGEQLTCTYNKILISGDEFEENNFWHKLGVLATIVFSDGKITFGDAVTAAEFMYRLVVKKR